MAYLWRTWLETCGVHWLQFSVRQRWQQEHIRICLHPKWRSDLLKKFRAAYSGGFIMRSWIHCSIRCSKGSNMAMKVLGRAGSGTYLGESHPSVLWQHWSDCLSQGAKVASPNQACLASLPPCTRDRGTRWGRPSKDRWKGKPSWPND